MIIEKQDLEVDLNIDIKNNIIRPDLIIKTKCFNLLDTIECGQCFRWKKTDCEKTEFIGVISDRVLRIKQCNDLLYIWSNVKNNLKEKVEYYFDLYNDYCKIENDISKIDNHVKEAVKKTSGIHILNQDPFETLISFIISSNNNIPRITKSIEKICSRYGRKVIFENEEYYLFPKIEELKNVTEEEFKDCGVGFRDKYLVKTIFDMQDRSICPKQISCLDNARLKTVLMSFSGVGPKVADCVMLFSFGRQDVFPIDVWVKRVMEKLYFKKETTLKDIIEYSEKYFGSNSGIVQQHLFHNMRNAAI